MYIIKKVVFYAITSIAILGLEAAHAQVKLSLGHMLTADSHYQAYSERFKELVETRSRGNIVVNIFGQMQLGGEVRMLQSARSGALDLTIVSTPPLENTVPEYAILSTPFLFHHLEQATQVLQGEVGQHFLDYLPQRGLVGLGFLSAMERNIFTAKRPVRSLADLQNLKLRVIQSPAHVETYQALGTQPTPMAYAEIYIAIQNGVVDGAENSPEVFIMDRFVEVSRFYSMSRIHYMPALVAMSKRSMDKLSPEHQTLVRQAAHDAIPVAIEAYRRTYEDSMAKIVQAGVEIIALDRSEMIAATRTVAEKFVAQIPDGKRNIALLEAAIARAQ